MNATPDSDLPEESPRPVDAGADAEAKPVRRKRAVKIAVADDAQAAVAEQALPALPGDSGDSAEPADTARPARKRRVAAAMTEDAADHPPAMEMALAAAPQAASGEVAPTTADTSTEASTPSAGEGSATPESSVSDGPRSERSRRRGRRDRGRAGKDRAGAEGSTAGADMAASGGDFDDDDDEPDAVVDDTPAVPPQQAGEVFAQVLSGEFDEVEEAVTEAPSGPPKRVLAAEPDAPKLHKVLAQAGVGSRRDMEQWIADGLVTVNGQPAHTGQRISFGDQIKVNGKPVRVRIVPPPPRIIAYHKPAGEVVTHDDPEHRPTVFRRLPRLQQGKWQSVGRLDLNTEGLLLFTNSGELANQLMHPRFGVEREYAVRVLGILTPEDKARLLEGVDVEGQKASFRSIEEGGGDGANHWYRVVITEGRNREVRKLFDTVSLTVSRLIRIRYGTVVLPFGLKRGVWVDLEDGDVRAIRRLAGAGAGQGPREGAERGDERGAGGPQGQRNDRQGGRQNNQNSQNNNRRDNPRDAGPRDNPRNAPRGRNPDNSLPAPSVQANGGDRERDFDRDDDADFDIDPASIPNPLEQTFDKRFAPNPRSPVGGRGFGRGGGGFGAGGSAPAPSNKKGQTGPKQPDPLQTSLGFIGADAFHRKGNRGGGGGGGGGGGRGGNRGGGGGGGYGGGNGGGGGGNSGGFGGGGGGRRGR